MFEFTLKYKLSCIWSLSGLSNGGQYPKNMNNPDLEPTLNPISGLVENIRFLAKITMKNPFFYFQVLGWGGAQLRKKWNFPDLVGGWV